MDDSHSGDSKTEIQLFRMELETMRMDGLDVPKSITEENIRYLIGSTPSEQLEVLNCLHRHEIKRKEYKAMKTKIKLKKKPKVWNEYGLNTIIPYELNITMDKYLNNPLIPAMQFSQHLVIDCSYQKYMTLMESRMTAREIAGCFGANRNHIDPFNIHLCNVKSEEKMIEMLKRYIPKIFNKEFPINIEQENYTDLYNKESLVYLTPYTKHELLDFNDDDVYVIGAYDGTPIKCPFSLQKAQAEGLRVAKLPISRYMRGRSGIQVLSISTMIKILLDVRYYRNWNVAFSHINKL